VWVGHSEHTLDAKNRVFLPKRLVAELDLTRADERPKVVLTRGFEGCLFLFSPSGYAATTARLDTEVFTSPEQRRLQRLFFSQSYDLELDAQLRVLVPERLKELAGIDKDVVVVGVNKRIEIWAKDRWKAFEAENLDQFDRMGDLPNGKAAGNEGS
jgi:MraZ protein